jgi:hypothetical protein
MRQVHGANPAGDGSLPIWSQRESSESSDADRPDVESRPVRPWIAGSLGPWLAGGPFNFTASSRRASLQLLMAVVLFLVILVLLGWILTLIGPLPRIFPTYR